MDRGLVCGAIKVGLSKVCRITSKNAGGFDCGASNQMNPNYIILPLKRSEVSHALLQKYPNNYILPLKKPQVSPAALRTYHYYIILTFKKPDVSPAAL